jgi:hypothetical protein
MPNLEEHAVRAWLIEIRPTKPADAWPPTIRPIEAVDEVPSLLLALGDLLDEFTAVDGERLQAALRDDLLLAELQAVLAQMGAARALRLLHWIAESTAPHSHAVVTMLAAGETAAAKALRATISSVTRRAALQRMFSAPRVAALQSAALAALKEPA